MLDPNIKFSIAVVKEISERLKMGAAMVVHIYFLIAANAVLQGRMASHNSDVAELLTSARLWSSSHSDRSDWTVTSQTIAVKLLYLAHLRQEYSQYEEYRSILLDQPITAETFDRWWSVTPLFIDGDLDDFAARLNPAMKCSSGFSRLT